MDHPAVATARQRSFWSKRSAARGIDRHVLPSDCGCAIVAHRHPDGRAASRVDTHSYAQSDLLASARDAILDAEPDLLTFDRDAILDAEPGLIATDADGICNADSNWDAISDRNGRATRRRSHSL